MKPVLKLDTLDYSLGTWIKRRRKALDLTQQNLAKRVGCSASLIFKIESDERSISRQMAELLVEHLEIPPDQRDLFMKVARQEKMVDRLASPSFLATPQPFPVSQLLPTNLPFSPTSILGRQHELHVIIQQIQDPACRLLTLTGPGGVGKTRLAIEVAHQIHEKFMHSAWFVSLVGTSAPEFIIPAIAGALGFSFSGTTEVKAQLFNFLRGKRILLVLDNLEHLLNGVELLGELLEFAPHVKLLTTSREPLNLHAEWVFEVQGLPVPPNLELNNIDSNSAAALFIQRAKQVRMNFTPAPGDLSDITHICRLVEGLPLGIELAAAWVPTLSCREIAQELERNLDFLAVSARDVPARHRSLRTAFDHSWNLLVAEEQRALRQLSVFRGGFTREAAEQVAGATLPVLSALVDKSLLRHTGAQHPGRYDFHELIRQYAVVKLQGDPEEHARTQERHANYFAALLHRWEQLLKGAKHKETLEEIVGEIDNVRLAWNWIVVHKQAAAIRQSTGTLWWFYELRGWYQEGLEAFRRAAEALQVHGEPSESKQALACGRALTYQGYFLHRLGQETQAREVLLHSFALLRPLGDHAALADALICLGWVALRTGDFVESRRLLDESLALSRPGGYRWNSGLCLSTLGVIAYILGEYQEAQILLRESLKEWGLVGDPRNTAASLIYLGAAIHAQGEVGHAEAGRLLQEGLVLSRAIGDRYTAGIGLSHLGVVTHAQGEHTKAQSLLRESIALFKEISDGYSLAEALTRLGDVAVVLEDYAEARRAYHEGFVTAVEVQALPLALGALVRIAAFHAKEAVPERALELVLQVLNHPASEKETQSRAERLRAELESKLIPQQIEAAQARARATSFEAVVTEILEANQAQ